MGAIASRLDNLNLASCAWFPQSEKRNAIASIVAGLLFFTGWWFLIDVQSVYPEVMSVGYHFCGIVGSISLMMINAVSNSQVRGDSYSSGRCGPRGARLWLFIGFVMGFGALIASCWILFANFVAKSDLPSHWPGAGLFLQNVFIFAGSLIYKFCRTEEQF